MILIMEIRDEDKKVLKTEKVNVTSNSLNRLKAPQLFGMAFYQLKKNRKVEIKCQDGSILYTLEDGFLPTKAQMKAKEAEEAIKAGQQ